jgi:hypothetical protein
MKGQEVAENCMRSFITCTVRQVKEDEMGRACSMNWGEEEWT